VSQLLSLADFTEEGDAGDECDDGVVALEVAAATTPRVLENLRRLRRLDLLTDEVVWALVGQAPIDPLGVYGALKHRGVWAFSPLDFTVVQVLAKKGAMPVAAMRVCLLSNDIVFIAMEAGQLVAHASLSRDQIEAKLREPGCTEATILAWLKGYIDEAVAAGYAAVQ
jgi:hypothetical protein